MSECVISFSQNDSCSCNINISLKLLPTICFLCECDITDEEYRNRLATSFPHMGIKTGKKRFLVAAQKQLQQYQDKQKPYSGERERLLCKSCLAERILSAKFNDSADYIDCPFGRRVNVCVKSCFAHLSSQQLESFKCKMVRFTEEQNFFCYTCPFVDRYGACDSQTLYPKNKLPHDRVTNCIHHGNRCVKCWEVMEDTHSCCKYPKSVFTDSFSELYRCPRCLAIIEKNNGCCQMACNCGMLFDARKEAIYPLNSKIIPLRLQPKPMWTMPKPKKTKKQRQLTPYEEEEEENYEDNVAEDLWLERKRSHPRSTH